jgi:hypothetical protein
MIDGKNAETYIDGGTGRTLGAGHGVWLPCRMRCRKKKTGDRKITHFLAITSGWRFAAAVSEFNKA